MGWLAGAGELDDTTDGARFSPAGMAGVFRLAVTDELLHVHLEPLPGRAGVDVSPQPAVLAHAVARSAEATGADPSVVDTRVANRIREIVGRHRAATLDGNLVATAGAASFPLLVPAYRAGRDPIGDIPRWATRALRQPDARRAATVLFGPVASRRVVAAFARRLVGTEALGLGGPVDLFRLAMAHAASVALDADRLTGLIDHDGPMVAAGDWPDVDTLRVARRVLAALPSERVARWLAGVVTDHRPAQAFGDLVHALRDTRHHLPARLPGHHVEVIALARSISPLDPRGTGDRLAALPARHTVPRQLGSSAEHDRRGPAQPLLSAAMDTGQRPGTPHSPDVRNRALRPPAVTGVSARLSQHLRTQVIPRPTWAPQVDGAECAGGPRLELARTTAELARWGTLLGNCLADYSSAAMAGRSVLVGVRHEGHLVACAEVTNRRVLRQLLGTRNRRVPDDLCASVLDHLTRAGALDAQDPANLQWWATIGVRS